LTVKLFLRLARNLEKIVRSYGATPATIGLFDGKVHIGLDDNQLERIANDFDSIKVSRRDIPYCLINKFVGGTTVAATMYLADAVGIRVFATGGLGGVHRGVMESFDISADLLELATTPVAVVCAGVKSILDVPKTLEYLESNSVEVIVYGKTINFPGFFTAETIWKAHTYTQSLEEIADIINCSRDMGLPSATVIACPIPAEHEAEGKLINEAIEAALMESREVGVDSKNVTPFLMKRVNELTGGASAKTSTFLMSFLNIR
uniref:Pseudouridine-5'-phosphate glycosidase n=1 Tax=Anisakis simplex TaxID=6269 RepID=A0A0M3IYS9_ANISI